MNFYDDFIGNDLGPEYNSLGHRCKEISNINFHNYILFAGDNIGLGLDKPIEETYPYIIASALGADYYNLCVFNGGLDAIRYNLISWFCKIKYKPKSLVISCEFLNSLIVAERNIVSSFYEPINLEDEYAKDLMDAGNMTGFFNARNMFAERQLMNVCTIPIYQITFRDRQPLFSANIVNIDHTDNMFDHDKISKCVITEIKKTTRRMMP